MYHVEPGEIIDVLAVLTGEPSFFTMRGKTDAIMVVISKLDFYQSVSLCSSPTFIVPFVTHIDAMNFATILDFVWQICYKKGYFSSVKFKQ